MGPGNPWGTGLYMPVASHQVWTTQGPGLDLLAPGLHPMETWRHVASVLDSLGVSFWDLGRRPAESAKRALFDR